MRKNRLFYNIQKNADSADILIYGYIGFDWFDSGNTAKQFVKDFKALEENYSRINVRINSPGGDIHEGLPIANAIRASKRDVHTFVDGIAYSMGAIIAISGKTVHIASNGLLMLHNASNIVWGNAEELRKAADDLAKYDDALIQTVADKTGLAKEAVKKDWFNFSDNYFTAQEALDNKLVDVVEDYQAEDIPAGVENLDIKQVFAYYNKMNENQEETFIDNMVKKVTSVFKHQSQQIIQPENTPMDFKKTMSLLAKGTLTPEDIAAIKAEVESFTGANEMFTKAEVDQKVADALKPVNEQLETVKNEFEEFKKDPKKAATEAKQTSDDRSTENKGEPTSWERKAMRKSEQSKA